MKQTFTIPSWHPPSLNTLLRLHWSKRNKAAKEAYQFVGLYWRLAEGRPATGKRSVQITILTPLTGSQSTRPDGDNSLKVLL